MAELQPLLPMLPLGLLAGLLSGLLGIGGGLIFSPILLMVGLSPHQALATSTLAIVPTTLGASWSHLRSGTLPGKATMVIAAAACLSAGLFSRIGHGLQGWTLLGLQALMYLILCLTITPRGDREERSGSQEPPWIALALVGLVAGMASGLVGVGGGLVMVPLMVRFVGLPIHLAIRLSTLAVLASASVAAAGFVADGRAQTPLGLLLGGTAAISSRWAAARLQRVSANQLTWLLRLVTLVLALDSGRRAVALAVHLPA
ncbi:MAG: sulfite exporter TauE/SafE family protein [Cyanobacteriota bacterium]